MQVNKPNKKINTWNRNYDKNVCSRVYIQNEKCFNNYSLRVKIKLSEIGETVKKFNICTAKNVDAMFQFKLYQQYHNNNGI